MIDESKTGHKRPPEKNRFKPGTSGNPLGRPKGSSNLSTDLTQLMARPVAIREDGKRRRISRQQAMLLSLFDKALHGDVRAINSITSMLIKLDPPSTAEPTREKKLSKLDQEIIEDFLRRNQPANS